MKKHQRDLTATIPIPVLIVASAMTMLLLFVPVSAGSVHGEGPGWKFNATETTLVDPATGTPFPSMGAFDRTLHPGQWDAMSPAARTLADNTPAISRSFDLSYTLNASQQAKSEQVETRSVTEAQYLSAVLPDLWAAIPEWQKEQYQNQPHHSLAASLPSVTGQFTGPFFGAAGSAPSSFGTYTDGFTAGRINSAFGNADSSWLSFGNAGAGVDGTGSSWLAPGQIPDLSPLTPDVPVAPGDFTWHNTLPFSPHEAGNGSSAAPAAHPMIPYTAAGMSHAGALFTNSGQPWWPSV